MVIEISLAEIRAMPNEALWSAAGEEPLRDLALPLRQGEAGGSDGDAR
jgi:hypothetical protein